MKTVEVNSADSSPALYIDGVKTLPMVYGLSDIPGSRTNTAQAQKNIRQFAEQGIHLITCDTELRLGWHKDGGPAITQGFYGIQPYEIEPMQAEIASAMDADPETKVILRLHVNAPYWWMRDHPEEQVIYKDKPGIDIGDTARLIRGDMIGLMRTSFASKKWLHDAGECLKYLCQHLWDTVEGRAVIAIQVACGWNGEWIQWGCDCSEPMKARFHEMLKAKYGTDEALQKAWGDPSVTLENAHFIPDPEQKGSDGIFRDPVSQRDIMDAQECIQLTVPEAILHFCRIVKENWGRPVLTGAFYNYYIQGGKDMVPIIGNLYPEIMYAHPEYIDFMCGPFPYLENRNPDAVPMSRTLIESNRINGRLWLTEMDQHPAGTEDFIGGDPKRMDETIGMLRRNTLLPLLGGEGMWFYDHRLIANFAQGSKNPCCSSLYRKTGWWDNPVLLREIKAMKDLCDEYLLPGYRPAADVLAVYAPKMHFTISHFIEDEYAQHDALARSGAAYDCLYLSDLEKADMDRYRCVVFLNAYCLNEKERKRIRDKCAGRQVVFLYAAGFSDGKTLSESNIRAVTGISVKRTENAYSYRSTDVLGGEQVEYCCSDFHPLFSVDDPEAEPLAHYATGEIAAARKGDNWYFALPKVTGRILRHIFTQAGAHIYTESADPIIAGGGLVAVNTFEGGAREITLKNGKRVSCVLAPYETAVFDAETGERKL